MKKLHGLILICLLIIGLSSTCIGESKNKQYYQYKIDADGAILTVDAPPNATIPIERIGDNYVLLEDIGSLAIAKSNIVLDGNGHGLPGTVTYTFLQV
jgi:hypothetical protein